MNRPVDLRSDTMTRPTPGMLEAMMSAEVGDDVWGEDPSVHALETQVAETFAHEAAVFCPSGTMTNQIALRVHLQPGDEVICSSEAHIYNYEGGGIAANAGASVAFATSERGRFTAAQAEERVRTDDPHHPRTRLIAVEDTSNRGGGAIWPSSDLRALRKLADARSLALHLDGARVFNRLVAAGDAPEEYGRNFDSLSVCLSKGLGAPVGSVLIGPKSFIARARRMRKLMGGGMRQAGFMAAAGRYALDHHVDRLSDDHRRARALAEALESSPAVRMVLPVETNIVIFEPLAAVPDVLASLDARGVKAAGMGARIRFVTHLDIDDQGVDRTLDALAKLR